MRPYNAAEIAHLREVVAPIANLRRDGHDPENYPALAIFIAEERWLATVAALSARVAKLEAALRLIAYAEGTGPVNSSWDEPGAAEIARTTLEATS